MVNRIRPHDTPGDTDRVSKTMAEQKPAQIRSPESGDRLLDHLELAAVMGQDFAASLDIEDSLRRAVEHITRYLDAAGGALFLLDESGDHLRCHACR